MVPFSAVGLLALFFVAARFLQVTSKHDPREPPAVPSLLPFIGHALGLFRNGVSYFVMLRSVCLSSELFVTKLILRGSRSKVRHPIYTINLLKQTVYVINDPDLISQVQREKKISNNGPFVETVFKRMLGNTNETMSIILNNMDGYRNEPSYRRDMRNVEHKMLAPGAAMDQVYVTTMSKLAERVRELTLQAPQRVCLMTWIREMFTLSTALALYGPENPFELSRDLEKAFW